MGGREEEREEGEERSAASAPGLMEPFKAWMQASLSAGEAADFLVLASAGGSTDTSFPGPWSPGVRLE